MNLKTIRNRARTNLANLSTTAYSDASLTSIINEVYDEIARSYRFAKLDYTLSIQTVADKADYTIPDNVLRISEPIYIAGDTNDYLRFVTDREYFPISASSDTSNKPIYVLADKRQFTFYPVPDDAYDVYFTGNCLPDDLSDDLDEPITSWENCIIAGTTFKVMLTVRDDYTKYWGEMYRHYLDELIGQEEVYKIRNIRGAF